MSPFSSLSLRSSLGKFIFAFVVGGVPLAAAAQVNFWRAERTFADEKGDLAGTPFGGTGYAPGAGGAAWLFDGVDDVVRFSGAPLAPPWTLTLWVRREDAAGPSASLLNDTLTAIKLEQWQGTRKVGFTQFGVGDWAFDYTAPAGRWVHLTMIAAAGSTSLYADGKLAGSIATTVNLPRAFIGGLAGDRLKGRVDDLKIWDRALTAAEIAAQASVNALDVGRAREASPTVPNVLGAFNTLTTYGESLAFNNGPGVPIAGLQVPAYTAAHYQGIQRWHRPGSAPYLFVSRAGQDVGYGNLLVVRMGSRNTTGERMRSNRLLKDFSVSQTAPPAADIVVRNLRFDYEHLGSLQLCGDILAVPLEDPVNDTLPTGRVEFFNMADPTAPVKLPVTIDLEHKVGVVGLARLPDGHFLVVLTWGKNETLEFYRSNHTSFFEPGFAFTLHSTITASTISNFAVGGDTKTADQSLSLILQDDGRLFMLTARNTSVGAPFINGDDKIALFEVRNTHVGGTVQVDHITEKQMRCSVFGDTASGSRAATNDSSGNFLAAGGTYVSPTGELLFYAGEYYNDGPAFSVRIMEFRHNQVSRPGGPAHYPFAAPGGPYRVLEGATLPLNGGLSLPVRVKPWIHLHDDDNFGGTNVMVDWDDYFGDDYQDFRKLQWNDKASSVRWFVPPGYTANLHDGDNFTTSSTQRALGLGPPGWAGEIADLSDEPWNFDDDFPLETRVTSVRFISPPTEVPATARVGQPLEYLWSLPAADDARVKLQNATTAAPNAVAIDGPFLSTATLKVSQPGPFGVLTDQTEVVIQIVNAPPEVTSFTLAAATNARTARAALRYRDPGVLDTHTIEINWGDGSIETFSGAAGGTRLDREHTYADTDPSLPLSTNHIVAVRITDNDGGTVAASGDYLVTWRTLAATDDRDGDGLPDYWEDARLLTRAFFGGDDPDRDGFDNRAEYLAGTDPRTATDHPRLAIETVTEPTPGQRVSFTATAPQGPGYGTLTRRYRLESSPSLAAGSWTPVPGFENVVAANQPVAHHSTAPAPRFFRTVVWLE